MRSSGPTFGPAFLGLPVLRAMPVATCSFFFLSPAYAESASRASPQVICDESASNGQMIKESAKFAKRSRKVRQSGQPVTRHGIGGEKK
jgi:hypothetical protein